MGRTVDRFLFSSYLINYYIWEILQDRSKEISVKVGLGNPWEVFDGEIRELFYRHLAAGPRRVNISRQVYYNSPTATALLHHGVPAFRLALPQHGGLRVGGSEEPGSQHLPAS